MNKEDSIAELEHDIRTLEEQLADILKADVPNLSEKYRIEDLINEKKDALEKLTVETAQNSRTDFKQAKETKEEIIEVYQTEITQQSEEIKTDQDKQMFKQNEEEAANKSTEVADNQELQNDDGQKFTLVDWQIKTGIDIIPDEYIKKRYDKHITEAEFKEILSTENVPKIVKEPGKAEMYLKTPEDWESVRTSVSALKNAVENGNFPRDVYDESYILLQYDKDKIYDNDKEPENDGYGKIDEDDIFGRADSDDFRQEVREEEDLEEETDKQDDSGGLWQMAKKGLKSGIKAMLVKDAIEQLSSIMQIDGYENVSSDLTTLVEDIIAGGASIGMHDLKEIISNINNALNKPQEIDYNNDIYETIEEEPQPGFPRRPY